MHLLILTHHFPPEFSGDATMQFELARHLTRRGHRVTVVTSPPHHHMVTERQGWLPGTTELEGVKVTRVRTPRYTRHRLVLRALQDLVAESAYVLSSLRRERADVVLIWCPPITLPILAAAYKHLRKSRLLVYMQDAFPEFLVSMGILERGSPPVRLGEWLEHLAYRHADLIGVHSPRNRAHVLERGVPPECTQVLPMWVDTDLVTPQPRRNHFAEQHQLTNKFVVLYAGTVGHAMGVSTIPHAAELLAGHADIEFVIAGDGTQMPRLKEEMSRRGLSNLRLLPLQPRETLARMLAAADVLLVCLRRETTDNPNGYFRAVIPHKVLTCMAAGRPILASTEPHGDLAALVRFSDSGFVVPPEDANALARAVLAMKRDARLPEWGQNARRFVCRYFSCETQLPEMERLLLGLAQGSRLPVETVWQRLAPTCAPTTHEVRSAQGVD